MQTKSENLDKLLPALLKAQQTIKQPTKDAKNPFFKSRYSDLSSVMDACREELAANALVIVQTMVPIDGVPHLETRLFHESGQWIASYYPLKPAKDNDPQALGAASTYSRRYAVLALLAMCPEDDDGNEASGRTEQASAAAAASRQAFIKKTQGKTE